MAQSAEFSQVANDQSILLRGAPSLDLLLTRAADGSWGEGADEALAGVGGGSPVTVDVNALADPIPDLPDVAAYAVVTGLAGYAQPGMLAVKPRSGLDIQVYWPLTP